MGHRCTRGEVEGRLRATISTGRAIIVAGAGNGLSAICAERGGIDLVVVYNSGKFRVDGLPSICGLMPYGNANEIVLDLGANHVIPANHGVARTSPPRHTGKRFHLNMLSAISAKGELRFMRA
jgi:predicted TIM-barrel enzyme